MHASGIGEDCGYNRIAPKRLRGALFRTVLVLVSLWLALFVGCKERLLNRMAD